MTEYIIVYVHECSVACIYLFTVNSQKMTWFMHPINAIGYIQTARCYIPTSSGQMHMDGASCHELCSGQKQVRDHVFIFLFHDKHYAEIVPYVRNFAHWRLSCSVLAKVKTRV